jgi:hypothetical protein
MPEFILEVGEANDATALFESLDAFTQGYIEAMFFTSTGPDNAEEGLGEAEVSQFAVSALESIKAQCERWQAKHAAWLEMAYERDYDEEQAGRDYWYCSQGHGVGFWDRKPLEAGGLGDALTRAAEETYTGGLYRGDDGLLYVE